MLSIIANVAHKVDRLEYVRDGCSATHDKSLFDTAIDLLIHTFKYQTDLADKDKLVAITLFAQGGVAPPGSDGPAGFESLLTDINLMHIDQINEDRVSVPASNLCIVFADVTTCIGTGATGPLRRGLSERPC
ncbi:MAG: hypothetical protein ACRDQU_17860 [Pseudonocardiaceae bacterium]